MQNGKKLLLTLVDNGGVLRARYAVLKGHAVQAEGYCPVTDLPANGGLRVVFLGRSSYFDRIEVEAKSRKMQPFTARRQVDAALAFSEPYRLRFSAKELGPGRQRLNLLAVSEAEFAAASAYFPRQSHRCERLALVESAIAALVAQATREAASVLWLRGPDLLGLLIENGSVLFRLLDRAAVGGGEEALRARLERMRGSLQARARRVFPDRELALHLALGELADKPNTRGEGPVARPDLVSSTLELRLAQAFTGAQPPAVLEWPEIYGLLTLERDYSLLDSGYQQRTWAEKFAFGLGAVLFAGGLLTAIAAFTHYLDWQQTRIDYENRRAKVDAEYTAIKPRLPTPAQLLALEQRLKIENSASDFRVDSLLEWISKITPSGATIRKLETSSGKNAVDSGATVATGSPAVLSGLKIGVEWELQGNYPEVERLAAQLAELLGARTTLADSKLEYTPGEQGKSTARLSTVLAPLPGAFQK